MSVKIRPTNSNEHNKSNKLTAAGFPTGLDAQAASPGREQADPVNRSLGQLIVRIWHLFFNREVIVYFIAGVLATLVNLIVFTLLSNVFGRDRWWLSNLPAIIAAILFAFFTNRIVVFRSKGNIWTEMVRFFAARVFTSLLFEYGAMFLLYNVIGLTYGIPILQWQLSVSKLLTQILVMVGNYVISKWFIFTPQQNLPAADSDDQVKQAILANQTNQAAKESHTHDGI